MLQRRVSTVTLGIFLIVFSVLCWLFPTLRYELVGTQAAQSRYEIFITALPDLFAGLLLLIGLFAMRNAMRMGNRWLLNGTDKIMIVFWLSNVVLGIILSGNPKYSALGFRITYLPMLFYFLGRIYGLDQTNFSREKVLYRIFLIFAAFAITGIVLYFGWPLLGKHMAEEQGYEQGTYFIPRMTSILWTPVPFGTMMAFGAIFFAYRVLRKFKVTDFILFCLFFFCLFYSVSRGPILGFLIGLIAMIFFSRGWKMGGIIIVTIFVIAATISLAHLGDLRLMKWIFKSSGETVMLDKGLTRVNRWEETWKDFRARPWGYGLGKAGQTANRYLQDRHEPAAPWSTDGWLLKTGCETGIWGLASYLLLCLVIFTRQVRVLVREYRLFVLAAFGLLLMTNAQALVSNVYDFYPLICFYWLIIGMAEQPVNYSKN